MKIMIETKAIQTLLYGTLSCQCPVTPKTEEAWVGRWREISGEEITPIEPFMRIADANPHKTPLHIFVDFCTFSKENPDDFTISQDDALRYFSSVYHFDRILDAFNPLSVFDSPSHLVGHMLLPVKLEEKPSSEDLECSFSLDGRSITFKHVVLPPDVRETSAEGWYGFHFGSILTGINERQKQMVEAHLLRIEGFRSLLGKVREVDYRDYQSFGNYHDRVVRRYERNGFL